MALVIPVPLHNQLGGAVPAKVSFYSQGRLFSVNGVSGQDPRNRLDGMIISIETDKDLSAPCGTFSITLHNRPITAEGPLKGQYLADVIEPMDVVVISFRRGPGSPQAAMIGVVGQRPTENEGLQGAGWIRHTVTISGFDMGKLLLNTMIYYFSQVPGQNVVQYAERGFSYLSATGAFPAGSKAAIARVLMENIFYPNTSVSFQRDEGQFGDVHSVLGYLFGKTYGTIPVGLTMFDQEQSCYSFLDGLIEKPWCELFVETWPTSQSGFLDAMVRESEVSSIARPVGFDGGFPMLFLRQSPFDQPDWEALPRFDIDDSVIHDASLGGEPTIYNTFSVGPMGLDPTAESAIMAIVGTGLYFKDSAQRYGTRVLSANTRVFPPLEAGNQDTITTIGRDLVYKLYTWFAPSMDFRSGSICVQGNPIYRVGTRLRRTYQAHRSLTRDFYVEGVGHNWEAFGSYRTNLRLTRGLPTTGYNRFPLPIDQQFSGLASYPFRA